MNLIFNFTGIYEEEELTADTGFTHLDLREMTGVTGYCSEEAMKKLEALISRRGVSGLHFLDSGNYHYLTRIFLGEIREPFGLLLFDNHTDAGEPAFSGIPLSCGSWLRHALATLPLLQQVILIGPSEKRLTESSDILDAGRQRIFTISGEQLASGQYSLPLLSDNLPLYLSLDKDVFSEEVCKTNWDQGEIQLSDFYRLFGKIFHGSKLLGADICGEFPREGNISPEAEDIRKNREVNLELASRLLPLL